MNQVVLKGRLTRDVDIRYTQTNNTKIANISIAVQRKFKNQVGEYEADFFNCIAFGNQANFLEKYFKKGQEILLSGRLQTRNWETDTGEKRYATEIIIENIEFCGSKKENNNEPENVNQAELDVNVVDNGSNSDLPF